MKGYEYFHMKLELFPQDIIAEYDLTSKFDHNGNVHYEVQRGMCGFPQAGIILTQELLEEVVIAHKSQLVVRGIGGVNPPANLLLVTTVTG